MKVILKQNVDNLGAAGDVVDVADGYGNNFLLPRNLAMRATRGALKDADAIRNARIKREASTRAEAEELRVVLERSPVRMSARAGEDGTLFGSIGNTAVTQAVREQTGVSLDRRRVPMARPLKTVGTHEVDVRVHPEIVATLRVEVVPET